MDDHIALRKKNTFWNMVYSLINAAQSAVLLALVNRVCNEEKAGVFSYAFSVALLFMFVGNYGIRNYQVSDTNEKYTPGQYYASRFVTVGVMTVSGLFFVLLGGFGVEKAFVVFAFILSKAVEAFEDVFHGRYQQNDRLYVASVQGSIRFLVSDAFFCIVLFACGNIIYASLTYFAVSVLLLLVFSMVTLPAYGGFRTDFSGSRWILLLTECFPLFLNYFLITYLANASKYALERFGDDIMQAHFNMIFMPVLVVNLLSTLIFRPIIVTMARCFNRKEYSDYMELVHRQEKWIGLIGIIVLLPSYLVGIRVLEIFFGSSLNEYLLPFMLLMLGGVFSAYSSFYNVCIVTLRGQKQILYITSVIAIGAAVLYSFVLSVVSGRYLIFTASVVYLAVMMIQMLAYIGLHRKIYMRNVSEDKPPVGILTVYSFNYGSYFQATALYEKIKSLGFECEFVNERFKKKQWGNLFMLYTFHDLLPTVARRWLAGRLPQYLTYLRLREDVKGYRESDPDEFRMKEITKDYDLVILGADELWSANPKSIRYTPEFFGYDITAKHCAYATCGTLFNADDSKLLNRVKEGLNSFDEVAVRDEYTVGFVGELRGERPAVVLDPTLLYPYFIRKYEDSGNDRYVLLYGSEYNEAQREYIISKAAEMNAAIYAMGWPQDFADRFLDPENAEEFQKCFACSQYCFPSTFHGTVFSILHHKQFVTMNSELRGIKIRDLLERLELKDRLFIDADTEYGNIDYDKVEEKLLILRKDSEAYLKGILEKYCRKTISDVTGDRKSCTGCAACENICPKGAIRMTIDEEGFAYPVIDKDLCVKCDACRQVCPSLNRPEACRGEILGAVHRDNDKRIASSSGGAFRALAEAVLADGGIVYGASFDESFLVTHAGVSDEEGLNKLRGSKYVSGDIKVYEEIRKELEEGREVLFSGTPCETAGMRSYLTKCLGKDRLAKLYLCDIVCHGLPSPLVFNEYLAMQEQKFQSKVNYVNFRNKDKGWEHQQLELGFENGAVYTSTTDADPYYILYFANLCDRPSCHQCPYASYDRISDITLGDYWGNEDSVAPFDEKEKGVSLLLVNTEQGRRLLKRAISAGLDIHPGDMKSAYQPIFEQPTAEGKNRADFWKEACRAGMRPTIVKYGRLSVSQYFIKRIIAPAAKKAGLYKLAQKVYFNKSDVSKDI